jgi:hypothetical protein
MASPKTFMAEKNEFFRMFLQAVLKKLMITGSGLRLTTFWFYSVLILLTGLARADLTA